MRVAVRTGAAGLSEGPWGLPEGPWGLLRGDDASPRRVRACTTKETSATSRLLGSAELMDPLRDRGNEGGCENGGVGLPGGPLACPLGVRLRVTPV